MAKKGMPHPTDRELAILRVLWQQGPCNVRQVNQVISRNRPTGYTTTLKLMLIMVEKGLLLRDESTWPHTYRCRFREEQTQGQILRRVLEGAFGGSAEKLVMRLLASKRASPEELARIRDIVDKLEEDQP